MIEIKIALYGLIVICCIAIGVKLSERHKKLAQELHTLKQLLGALETQVLYYKQPIASALETISQELDGVSKKICEATVKQMDETVQESFSHAWEISVEKNTNHIMLEMQVKKALKQLGKIIETTQYETQKKYFLTTKKMIDTSYIQAEKNRKKNEALYLKLSVLTGVAVVICLL